MKSCTTCEMSNAHADWCDEKKCSNCNLAYGHTNWCPSKNVSFIASGNVPEKFDDETHLDKISLGENPGIDILEPNLLLKNINKENIMNNNNSFIQCSYCVNKVHLQFLTKHIKEHIIREHVSDETSHYSQITGSSINSAKIPEVFEEPKEDDVVKFLTDPPTPKIKSLENFSFRPVNDVSFISFTNKTKLYSDFSIIVWLKGTSWAQSGQYYGHNASNYGFSGGSERLVINLIYDSIDDFFTIKTRLLKRYGYSENDAEESVLPDRIIFQEDILFNIRAALLFHKISPKAVLKKFMKNMKKNILLSMKENSDYIFSASSENHFNRSQELKKANINQNYNMD